MQNRLAERSTWTESRFYQKHKDTIQNATPKVDNKAPMLNVSALYGSTAIRNNVARLMQIDNGNYNLAKRINTIYCIQGKYDFSKPTKLDKKISNTPPTETINEQIHKQNIILLTKIINAKPRIDFNKIKTDQKLYDKILLAKSKYPEFYKKTKTIDPLIVNKRIPNNIRIKYSKCYLDVADSTAGRQLGRLIVELYDCVVPETVLNFLMLCHRSDERQPGYAGTEFFRINPGLFCLGGDVQCSIGLGGVSAYHARPRFDNENYALSHNAPGTLSMFSFEKNYTASQFLITFKPLRTLDGKHVVFGRVVRGLNTLKLIEDLGFPSGTPRHKIIISKCGKFIDCD